MNSLRNCKSENVEVVEITRRIMDSGSVLTYLLYDNLEPMGAKGPTFSSGNMRGSWFVRSAGEGFALLCQAQSFPVPAFR